MIEPLGADWRTSTRTGDNGNCVEVRRLGDVIEVRDTKDRGGATLGFTTAEWLAFIDGVKDGEFNIE